MQAFEVRVWTASVADAALDDWRSLSSVLDAAELARSLQFRFEADRRAYVLAHALRRCALGQELGRDPAALGFSHTGQGRPELVEPASRPIFFSHSRTRGQVAFATSFDSPIGIDLEAMRADAADPALLQAFIDTPAAKEGGEAAAPTTEQFYFYWTALEAFWKAMGTGLADANPKIRCQPNGAGVHEVRVDGAESDGAAACVVPLRAPAGNAMSLAVSYPQDGARNGQQPGPVSVRASEKTHFFDCKRRLLRSSFTTIVSA
jgi:4'-phosphopantetheinyl transferase